MSKLLNTPTELQEKIFGYCYTSDLLNLMSCNSKYSRALKSLVSAHIHISLGKLQDEETPRFLERIGIRIPEQKKKLLGLKSARSLRVEGGCVTTYDYNHDGALITSDGTRMIYTEWLDMMAARYRQVMSYCSPGCVEEVRIDRVITSPDISYMCTTFTRITKLSISYAWHIEEVHFLPIFQLQDLVHLDLNNTPVGQNFLAAISENLSCLQFLGLHGCAAVTEEALEMLHVATLRTLDVSSIPYGPL